MLILSWTARRQVGMFLERRYKCYNYSNVYVFYNGVKPVTKHKKRVSASRPFWLVLLGLIGLGLLLAELMYGLDVRLLNPKGFIAEEQFKLIVFSAALLLVIGLPTLFCFYYFAWKYRETNPSASYEPKNHHSKRFVFYIWAIPSVFALILSVVMWSATHRLEPADTIEADARPITVQVVAMRWKWLFIYPEQKIASVNFVQFPADTPVHFQLTADESSMSSFWIPSLGGQLYAMTGHANQLNLIASEAGDYAGSTAEINGAGFAGMKFTARASSVADFERWVQQVRSAANPLDETSYDSLLNPSQNHPVALYSYAPSDLYAKVLMKYSDSHNHDTAAARPYEQHAGHE